MKNITTEEFCRRFGACKEGVKFALNYATMRACYDALLCGCAGDHSAEWAIWAATREGVMSERDLRLFAVKCARRVQHIIIIKDERAIQALDVAERYANGSATSEELNAAHMTAWAVSEAVAYASRAAAGYAPLADAWLAAWSAAEAVAKAAKASAHSAEAARAAEREAQLRILAEFGNPFEKAEE